MDLPLLMPILGAPERKAWIYWTSSSGPKYFLAFVNQFGSCSLRKFDDSTGLFVERQREEGDFQIAFGTYLSSGKRLLLSRQPNLETECRPTLPEWVLSELKRQIGNERRVA